MPSTAELIGAIVGLLALVGAGFLIVSKIEAVGAAKVVQADQAAIIKQADLDRQQSAQDIAIRDKTISDLQASAGTVREVIRNAPVTSGCGAAVGSALDWVRQRQLGGSAKAP